MHFLHTLRATILTTAAAAAVLFTPLPAAAQSEIVLTARDATNVVGNWQRVNDSTAADGTRLWLPDRGLAKRQAASATPSDYVMFTFTAEQGRPYRLWIRGKADGNAWTNDSAFVQFNASLSASGAAVYRIGTSSAAIYSVEACSACGLSGWGWEDNGWAGLGPLLYFQVSGEQRLWIQRREDGLSIDQVVLSAGKYLSTAPGASKNDSTTLAGGTSSGSTTEGTAGVTAPVASPSGASTLRLTSSSAATLRDGGYANTNLSGRPTLETRVGSPGYTRRIQLKFDTHNTIPLGTPVSSAQLTLTVAGGNAERRTLAAYRGSLSYDRWAATWNARKAGTAWPRPGGDMQELVFRQSVTNTAGSKVTFDVTTVVQGIVSGKYSSSSRYARFLIADIGGASRAGYKQYYSDEAADVSRRPVLTVTYSSGASAPAPAPEPVPDPAPAPAPADTGVKLRVLEWNIHHGVGTDGVYNIDRLATWIVRMNADVVLLNEVEKYTYWGNEDQPARFKAMLQAKTGRTWYTHFSQEFGQWSSNGKGHLILSIYPLESTNHVAITPSSGLKGAGAASQATIIVNGRTINFVLTHLDPYDHGMRLRQARDVISWAGGYAENRILAGDMNAWPDQTSIAEINKTYYDAWTIAASKGTATGISGITPFGATKKGRIDYIFYSKSAPNLVVLDARTVDTRDSRGVMPADHRPVVMTFEVR